MNTPICDFVAAYGQAEPLRLHMPGHKGAPLLGPEPLDITEITGADVLYSASGIIAESRENARKLFHTHATFYATEGSSLCIHVMVYLALQHAKSINRAPCILAARNVHRSFLHAAAISDVEVDWLYPKQKAELLCCMPDASEIDTALTARHEKPAALYLTSPDYLGNMADIEGIAKVCHKHDVLLMVDNAHGAYLQFLPTSRHPIALGADLCCDSAHKTLPALTGAAYLHIGHRAPALLAETAEHAFSIFASTSPSYLVLQSLDRTNRYLDEGYRERLADFVNQAAARKVQLQANGYSLAGSEPLKLTVRAKSYGYTGTALAALLQAQGIMCEFADADYLVLMLTPELGTDGLDRLQTALQSIPQKPIIHTPPPPLVRGERVCSIRQALFSPSVERRIEDAEGCVLAGTGFSCPPAVPILVCGERITKEAIDALRYYKINRCRVLDA